MGIVSEPWDQGKGHVTRNYRDTCGDVGWTEGQRRESEPPEDRRRHEGTRKHPLHIQGAEGTDTSWSKTEIWGSIPRWDSNPDLGSDHVYPIVGMSLPDRKP
jgi:hypothetical protein